MSKFSDRLRELRNSRGLSQQEFAKQLGCVSKSSINMYERGEREPNLETLETIADYFNIDMNYLLGKSEVPNQMMQLAANSTSGELKFIANILPIPSADSKPMIGSIACGAPILAEQNIEGYVKVPDWVHCDFVLRCKGDSMTGARIYDGDIVCIRQQPQVENGEIAAVLVKDEATLKRVRVYEDHVVLEPENPDYRPLVFWDTDMENVRILGKATYFISAVR